MVRYTTDGGRSFKRELYFELPVECYGIDVVASEYGTVIWAAGKEGLLLRNREITTGVKFANPMGIAVVSVDAFDMAQPHLHGPGCEEIWCQLKGDSLLMFGNQLRKQEIGMAFLIPPNFAVPHSSINPSDEPMQWLYLGNRHDARDSRYRKYHMKGWNWE